MEVDLEDRDLRVLELVEQYPRPTVTTLRESIHWADKNQHIHYRLDKLEERGLVETWKDKEADVAGALAPKRADVTEAGEELLKALDKEDRPADVEQRLTHVEAKVDNMQDAYGEVKRRIRELEAGLESTDGDVEGLADDVRGLRRAVEQLPAFTEDEFEFRTEDD